jgi:plasmid replication initiation protein
MPKNSKNTGKEIVLIKKSNNLVESRYKFDIWETRFFLSVLAQIRREDDDLQVYRIWYKDVVKTFGLKSGDSYAFLREAARTLMKNSVQVNYVENGVERVRELHLIKNIDYLKEGQKGLKNAESYEYIDVTVEEEMRPFLLNLQKSFTAYDLRNVVKLSVYSVRLYELLKQYESIGARTLQIEEMKRMFLVEEQYKLNADFYRWVIKPSENEINKHTDLMIQEVEKLKEGKKMVALRFKFRKKTSEELSRARGELFKNEPLVALPIVDLSENKAQIPPSVNLTENGSWVEIKGEIAAVDRGGVDSEAQEKLTLELSPIVVTQFGVSLKVLMTLVEKHTENTLRQAISITEKALTSGKIQNAAGFFVEAVRGNYQDMEAQKALANEQKIAEKRAKLLSEKQAEQAAQIAEEARQQNADNFKRNFIRQLYTEQPAVMQEALETIHQGMFKWAYDASKTMEENLQMPVFLGVLMGTLEKMNIKP